MEVRDCAHGAILVIGIQPAARRRELRRDRQGRPKLAVCEPPEDGRANRAALDLLAELLSVRKRQIMLVAGASSRRKTFAISGLSAHEVAERLGKAGD